MSQTPILKITYCLSRSNHFFELSQGRNQKFEEESEISLKRQVSIKKCFRKREKEGNRETEREREKERERELSCVFLKYNAISHSKLVLEIGFS